jgi:hypothetical protein
VARTTGPLYSVTTFPLMSTATQNDSDAQETDVTPAEFSTPMAVDQPDDVYSNAWPEPSMAVQKPGAGHETVASGLRGNTRRSSGVAAAVR